MSKSDVVVNTAPKNKKDIMKSKRNELDEEIVVSYYARGRRRCIENYLTTYVRTCNNNKKD